MGLKNTKDSYGLVAKIFHWPMALIILGLILVGLYMSSVEPSPEKLQLIYYHKSFGILILWLVGLRLIWRAFNKPPIALPNHKGWERLLAKLAHFFLYAAMIGMPLSGWLMSSAGEYPVPFFGLEMPDLVSKNPDLGSLMHSVHEVLAYMLIGVIILHSLGALKHHFMDEDETLKRMAAKPMRHIGPYLIVVILLIFGAGVLKMGSLNWLIPEQQTVREENITGNNIVTEQKASIAHQWIIDEQQSVISFQASVYNKEFTGRFSDFDGSIIFNPDDLKNSSANITIKINSIDSDDAERDASMLEDDWFAIADYQAAHFKTTAFEDKGEGQYLAVGDLTIKGKTMPTVIPFQLDIVPQDDGTSRAYMNGQVTLNRLDFGIGEGRWESGNMVGLTVDVAIQLVAFSNK